MDGMIRIVGDGIKAEFFSSLYIQTKWAFYVNLWAKGDHLMEISYLKAHPFGNRYPEWMPNLHSDRGQDPKAPPKAQAVGKGWSGRESKGEAG